MRKTRMCVRLLGPPRRPQAKNAVDSYCIARAHEHSYLVRHAYNTSARSARQVIFTIPTFIHLFRRSETVFFFFSPFWRSTHTHLPCLDKNASIFSHFAAFAPNNVYSNWIICRSRLVFICQHLPSRWCCCSCRRRCSFLFLFWSAARLVETNT